MSYGEKLKSLRKAAGLTQRKLGEACGYGEGSAERIVQLWEHDKQFPPIDKLRLLAAALHVSLNEVIP